MGVGKKEPGRRGDGLGLGRDALCLSYNFAKNIFFFCLIPVGFDFNRS
jgi:hypothetical protein